MVEPFHFFLVVLLPIFHPRALNVLTTFGVSAAVRGTRMNIRDLWTTNASRNCVQSATSGVSEFPPENAGMVPTSFSVFTMRICSLNTTDPIQLTLTSEDVVDLRTGASVPTPSYRFSQIWKWDSNHLPECFENNMFIVTYPIYAKHANC